MARDDIDRELDAHLAHAVDDLIRTGLTPEDARRQALLALGGVAQTVDAHRDVRAGLFDSFLHDLRFAARMLRRNPGFATAATTTLALGIGAVTVMFAVVSGVLFAPLPFPQPDRLVRLQERTVQASQYGNLWAFAYPNFVDARRDSRSLTLAAWRPSGGIISGPGTADYVDAREVSPELFTILGVRFTQGRAFVPADDSPSAAPVAIISHRLWQDRYGGANAIGSRLTFDAKAYTVVGVTSSDFTFLGADVFLAIGQDAAPVLQRRQAHPGIQVWGRLEPGATIDAARSELSVIGRRLAQQYPDSNAGRDFIANPLQANVGSLRPTLWLLLSAVAVVLLIACANIASLLLARAVARERELAMRAALGASRMRLVRQCLTESGVLGVTGGALGVAVAAAALRPFVALWPGELPRADFVHIDWRVLLFAFALSIVSSMLFGIAPALRTPATDVDGVLRAGARSVGGSRRLQSAFVVSEIALAILLLVAAGMFGRTLVRLSALDPGLDVHNVLVARAGLSPSLLTEPAKIRAAWADLLVRTRRVPGVRATAMVDTVPMRDGNNQLSYWTSAALPPPNQQPLALATSVTPEYLDVVRLPLRRGRFLDEHDQLTTEPVVVIDDVLASRAFGAGDPVGQRLWVPSMGAAPVRVVGVVAHVRHWGFAGDDDASVRAQMYYPFAQVPDVLLRRFSQLMSIAVRTDHGPLGVLEPLRAEVRGGANDQVLYEVRTLEQLASGSLAQHRFLLQLFSVFAAIALLLASVGLYGVLSYLVGRRTSEMGVRMTLGATSADIVSMVLRESLAMVAAGFLLGIGGALAGARALDSLVAGMRPPDVTTFVAVSAVLGAAALGASVLPAWRASRVDPLVALRSE